MHLHVQITTIVSLLVFIYIILIGCKVTKKIYACLFTF